MEILVLLVPLSLMIVAIALWVFFRMVDSGQFENLDRASQQILQDDDRPVNANANDKE